MISDVVSDVENTRVNNNEFSGDTIYTPKEDVERHRKPECRKGAISKSNVFNTWQKTIGL